MKTNLSTLMSIIGEEEAKFNMYGRELKNHVYNVSIQELNGNVTVMEDYKADFEKELTEYVELQKKITTIKSIIHQKNNEFKLSDGRTIQSAIIDNTNLRKMKMTYYNLLQMKNSKARVTEVNNSYFECKTVNFDEKEIREEFDRLESKIQETDFEIFKLNSIEFEVDI